MMEIPLMTFLPRLGRAAVAGCCGLLGFVAGWAQTAGLPKAPEFEAASVKPTLATMSQVGTERELGWGDVTGRVNLRSIPLNDVLMHVYRLRADQLKGPDWLGSDRFDIAAIVPAGVPKEDIPRMFEQLLMERFALRFHWEEVTKPCYALVVREGGAKLKETEPGSGEALPGGITGRGTDNVSVSGGTRGPYGEFQMKATRGGRGLRFEFASMTMKGLADFLSEWRLGLPVVDATGLKGNYLVPLDVSLSDFQRMGIGLPPSGGESSETSPEASEPAGVDLRESLKGLGLSLERRNLPVRQLVIEHIDRTPTPN